MTGYWTIYFCIELLIAAFLHVEREITVLHLLISLI